MVEKFLSFYWKKSLFLHNIQNSKLIFVFFEDFKYIIVLSSGFHNFVDILIFVLLIMYLFALFVLLFLIFFFISCF